MKELTILDSVTMFVPRNSRCLLGEKTIKELWPLRPNEFLPERNFPFDRYVSVFFFARKLGSDGTSANLLEGNYLNKIVEIEEKIETNVSVQIPDDNQFANITLLNRGESIIKFHHLCLNWHQECHRFVCIHTGGGRG